MKVLIADNHEVVRVGLKHLLKSWTVVEAADANSALKLFRKHNPDVTVLEVRIPGDGLNCLVRIKRASPSANVLMLSGFDNPTYIARAVALGAQGYVVKTATCDEIIESIKAVAKGEEIWTRGLLRQVSGSLASNGKVEVNITARQKEVLKQVALGLSNREIAQALDISYETVKEHVQNILRKLGLGDRTQAAVWAVRNELV